MIDAKKTMDKYGYDGSQLNDNSHKKVCVICDYCGSECEKEYKSLINGRKFVDKDSCKKCMFQKRADVSMKKYGVKNALQRPELKEQLRTYDYTKIHDDLIKCYNDGYSMSYLAEKFDVSAKSVRLYLKSLGLDTCGDVNEKKVKTQQEKYGDDYKKKLYDIRQEGLLKKHGVTNAWYIPGVQDKVRKTMVDRYGVENALQNYNLRERQKQTNIERYGVENPLQNEEIKERATKASIQTKIDRGITRVYRGMTVREWVEKTGYSKSRFNVLVAKHGFEKVVKMTPHQSCLEQFFEEWLKTTDIQYDKHGSIGRYIPDFILNNSVVIELDGLYWHSDAQQKDDNYHVKKRQTYIDAGYTPLFFREDELNNKFNIIKSIVLNKVGNSIRIGARKCIVDTVGFKIGNEFINKNHLMGKTNRGTFFGLYYNSELVSVISILRKNGDEYEISRFCSKPGYSITGGLSKLLKFAKQEIPRMRTLITFIDRRYGFGDYLTDLNFEFVSCYKSFRWTNYLETWNRRKFLGNSGYEKGFVKTWDCGQAKYLLKIK